MRQKVLAISFIYSLILVRMINSGITTENVVVSLVVYFFMAGRVLARYKGAVFIGDTIGFFIVIIYEQNQRLMMTILYIISIYVLFLVRRNQKLIDIGKKTRDTLVEKENILKNYELFTDAVGIRLEDVVIGNLNHGNNVRVATRNDAGCGILKPFNYINVDALVTNEPNLAITVTCADCVPVFFVDPIKKAIGIAHSGWKGTAQEISAKVVEKMVEEYGCKPEDIYAGVGPCIGMCCYEVSRDVFEEFLEFDYLDDAWYFEKDDDKFDLDLSRIIFGTLAYSGILPEHISISGLCTCCNNDVLFSHRAQKGKRGTMAGMIMLKGN